MQVAPNPAQGYFVNFRPPAGAEFSFDHYFAGSHSVPGAACPNCNKPLLCFLALDTRDPRLNLLGCPYPTLSLFYCWTCVTIPELFVYRTLPNDDGIALLTHGEGGLETEFPYEDYPPVFPGTRALLEPVPEGMQAALVLMNQGWEDNPDEMPDNYFEIVEAYPGLDQRGQQVGGEPYLVQGEFVIECPECKSAMPLLASIRNECLDERGFNGDDAYYVQVLFHFCRACHLMAAFNQCD